MREFVQATNEERIGMKSMTFRGTLEKKLISLYKRKQLPEQTKNLPSTTFYNASLNNKIGNIIIA